MKKLSLGISTCPNDTFIFDAMLNGKVDTSGLSFTCELTDVEDLNNKALGGEFDITKISYHAYAYVADDYILLNSGSALGYNNGPLLVTARKRERHNFVADKLAIPGRYTTANLLMSIIYPGLAGKEEYLFSDIEEAVLKGDADAGLLIHENRFTYEAKGLYKVSDLGEEWMELTAMPIPLGGIAVRRSLGEELALQVQDILLRSINFACENPQSSYPFVKKYAASMEREVMEKHINLYVNDFSRDLGDKGRRAVKLLYRKAAELEVIPAVREDIFV